MSNYYACSFTSALMNTDLQLLISQQVTPNFKMWLGSNQNLKSTDKYLIQDTCKKSYVYYCLNNSVLLNACTDTFDPRAICDQKEPA